MKFDLGIKKGHNVVININEEPLIDTVHRTYRYRLSEIFIDGEFVEKNKKNNYFYHEFGYKRNNGKKVFALTFEYEIVPILLKKLGVSTNSIKYFSFSLSDEVENYFLTTLNPCGEKALQKSLDEIKNNIIQQDKKICDDTVIYMTNHSSYGYKISCDESVNSLLLNNISEKLNKYENLRVIHSDIFKEFQTDYDLGDYSITTYYKLKYSELKKILKDIDLQISDYEAEKEKKKKEKQDKIDKLKKIAFETNTKQEYSRWSEPCNDPREECDVDIVVEYIMPDGTFKLERTHTW